ncbi:MAG: hypothetical protein COU29_04140 [Candidatus Magasanikbacteria bacterium CG10_big_fil_rev_8_21_14_0_10_36_32]|uniref:Spore protein YkvP/CgeB glycosyl transferase-like domain-containing protein n=1 Tax=Candidatus Magasanikbacteria bacterium CG10_big_fil_rev_8_21_14_0_10_36_32 TaxID=1974646 RepID=A0A2M6W5U8_9BACT|nr:MAG: hypothetical protein COU29_04140 [Candidatus Magasanikbacteria bacterium CG10_big_fil_rev_8_21_14_0_10_36_32]
MKILYIGLKYDYGQEERGYSFEHYNFYDSLVKMENGRHNVIYFPFDEMLLTMTQLEMNQKLLEKVEEEKPDLCFFFLFTDEIYTNTIKKITDSGVLTYNWFADDHWRWSIFSKYYAPNFSWVSTTDSQAVEKYRNIGYNNVIKTQWACNHFLYKKSVDNKDYKHEVSFVGASHGNRKKIIAKIVKAGVKIDCYGAGWTKGRVNQEQMMEIFSSSKINLNLTESSGGINIKNLIKIFISKSQHKLKINSPRYWLNYARSMLAMRRKQIKGRTFEIAGCGGFLISGEADNVGDYYIPDKEIVLYSNENDLLKKIKYYLTHDVQREEIRIGGYKRTISEHTYENRFKEIFKQIGL